MSSFSRLRDKLFGTTVPETTAAPTAPVGRTRCGCRA